MMRWLFRQHRSAPVVAAAPVETPEERRARLLAPAMFDFRTGFETTRASQPR